jgi:hypothetical protein
MKYIITFAILFLSIYSPVLAQEDKNMKVKGFRSFEWGKTINELAELDTEINFIEMAKQKDGIYYILAAENLVLGNVMLNNIQYVFSKKDDKFYKTVLTGKKEDVEQMLFIVEYKYGKHLNEDVKDDKIIKQWLIDNVTITLIDYTFNTFELIIESNWEAAEAFKKNTNVTDF